MSFSRETQEKIRRFAKEQSGHYLEAAEMTYLEKLRRKAAGTKGKAEKKLAHFKGSSEQGREAQNDMILYMSDYMNDLVSQGLTEEAAFETASAQLRPASGSEQAAGLQERFRQFEPDPAGDMAAGLLYGGFSILGLSLGALIGFLGSGGRTVFLSGGWIDTLIGAAVGIFLGVGCGLLGQALLTLMRKK